jgi:hypothetical protein
MQCLTFGAIALRFGPEVISIHINDLEGSSGRVSSQVLLEEHEAVPSVIRAGKQSRREIQLQMLWKIHTAVREDTITSFSSPEQTFPPSSMAYPHTFTVASPDASCIHSFEQDPGLELLHPFFRSSISRM